MVLDAPYAGSPLRGADDGSFLRPRVHGPRHRDAAVMHLEIDAPRFAFGMSLQGLLDPALATCRQRGEPGPSIEEPVHSGDEHVEIV
jgi:hypothetical protein